MTTFVMHDTVGAMRRYLDAPPEERDAVILREIVEPFRGMFAMMMPPQADGSAPDDAAFIAMVRQWQLLPEGDAAATRAALDRIEAARVPDAVHAALEEADAAFAAANVRVQGTDTVRVGMFLLDPGNPMTVANRGYTGFGATVGYLTVSLWPDDYTIPRMAAAAAHECYHQVQFSYGAGWRMDVSVGEYIVLEGLAESFATALHGEALAGPWVTEITNADVAHARAVIGANLDVRGFGKVRPFIFGGVPVEGGEAGRVLPHAAGYAVGYRVVQAYLKRAGQTSVQAMFTPAAQIIAQSGYFA